MQILSVCLKNIKSHRELEVDFSPGINVLSGPNGIGKSTIFEAIGYAMFGVDAQSFVGNVERFVTIGAKRGEVTVVFQINDQRYRVSRTAGTPARWLLAKEVGGVFEVEEHKDARETEIRLKELLGLAGGRSLAEQFELVIGPFQNEFLGPFVEKRPTARRNKFDEILGIDSWRKTYSETNSLLKTIRSKVEVLEGTIGPLQEQVMGLPDKREARSTAQKALGETDVCRKAQHEALKTLEALLAEIDEREKAIRQLGVEIDKLNERIGNGKEKVGSQKTLVAEAEKATQIVAASSAGKQAYEKAEQRLVILRQQARLQRELEKEVAGLTTRAGSLAERYAAETKAIERAEKEIDAEQESLAEKRKRLTVDQSVRTLAGRLPKLRQAISEQQKQIGRLDGRRIGLQEGREKLAEGICPFFQEPCLNIAERTPGDVFSAGLSDLEQERNRLADRLNKAEAEEVEANKASEQLNALAVQSKELDERAGNLDKKRQDLITRAIALEDLQKQQTDLQQQLDEKQVDLKAYERLQGEIQAAETELKAHQEARDRYVANQEQASKLQSLQADLRKFEELLSQLEVSLAAREKDLALAGKAYDADRHQALRAQKDALSQEVGALGQKIEGLKAEVARLDDEIGKLKQIEAEIAEKKKQIKAYGQKEELVKFLRNRVFNKVSAFLSERFREEISQRANRIYRIIAEVDEELAWGEDYRIVLRDMVDGELRQRADDQLSGGQIMSAVVALRLAMLQTIGARIAFFDEPTSNLDALRRENLAHAFRAIDVGKEEVTEHWYDQLFLISHDVAFTEVTDQILLLE